MHSILEALQRDYLNTHEEQAKEYSDLKEHLAKKYPEDRTSYTNGKGALIEQILRMADEWRKQSPSSSIE